MSFCPTCKKEIASGASICKHCGAFIKMPKKPAEFVWAIVICVFISLIEAGNLYITSMSSYNIFSPFGRMVLIVNIVAPLFCAGLIFNLRNIGRHLFTAWGIFYILINIYDFFLYQQSGVSFVLPMFRAIFYVIIWGAISSAIILILIISINSKKQFFVRK